MSDGDDAIPAWQRRTTGESRLATSVAVLAMIGLQIALPDRFLPEPGWLLPVLEGLLAVVLAVADPLRRDKAENWLRLGGLILVGLLAIATAYSAYHLVMGLIDGTLSDDPARLLGSGAAIWLTNVVVFGLGYWEFDRGGPAARAYARKPLPDFLFVQMQNPELTDPDWEPQFMDYLYLSFTNATAFSPTDVMPMTRWAKAMMMAQSAISLVLAALVIARAVNVLR
ncbi:DUF1345 domain-containing protein [Nocardia brasiliensis]|uniref:DUF1345 domain-containing protein n=1 Tax=Nocardia brasiliensis TaxID=37326 RepID=A0A6G9XL08_NOCBR|nr:DUF1345 domain-containing protein [Nocardia brasiliensis]QIS01594.1 DUF1345 domain-containing protein [Nocardia brasiliensis]